MKKALSLALILALCLSLLMTMNAQAASEETGTLKGAGRYEYTDRLAVSGNFDLTMSFMMEDGSLVAFGVHMYDEDLTEDAEHLAPNYVLLRETAVYQFESKVISDEQWGEKFSVLDYVDENLKPDTLYHMNIQRWKNKVSVKVSDDEGTLYWNIIYKPKAEMADRIYIRLAPIVGEIVSVSYRIGVSEGFSTFSWNQGWGIVAIIAILVAIVVAVLICLSVNRNYFEKHFGLVTGGLWGIAVLVFVCLLFPGGRSFLEMLIEVMIGMDGVVIPSSGFWFWLILVVCAGYAAITWILVALNLDKNPIGTTVLMLVLGMVYAIALYVLVGAVIQALLVAILILFVILLGYGRIKNGKVRVVAKHDGYEEECLVDESDGTYLDPTTGKWKSISDLE